jgi:X-Pro dipeptidyl-peptidase
MRSLILPLLLAAPLAAQTATRAAPVFANGMAQVVPAFQDTSQWIRQNLWVETDFDSDRDGKPDRVHVDVTRPGQTQTEGLKVAVVYSSSPYFANTAADFVGWDVKHELGQEPPKRGPMPSPAYQGDRTRISNQLVNTWVPRGFAVVHSEGSGTGRSQGCPTIGDEPERTAMRFVIDWLNGRARGFSTPTGSEQVRADWSTGKVGMIGVSYEGTLPLAAATTGVDGLEVVIPISPNTSYYHYYRANGLVRSPGGYIGEDVDVLYDYVASGDTATRPTCDRLWKQGAFAGPKGQDRASGDYNDFWEARDLRPHLKNVTAAVVLVHGLNDYNVMPSHSVRIYEELRRLGKKASLILHQGGHGGAPLPDVTNMLFSHYLYGVNNGVDQLAPFWTYRPAAVPVPGRPPIDAQSFASYPVPGSAPVTLYGSRGGNGIGGLATRPGTGLESLVDTVAISGSANASRPQSSTRLLYATAPLADTVHLSGTVRVTLRVASNKPAANLSVWVVTLPYDSAAIGSQGRAGVVTRGWADIQNHKALTTGGNYSSKAPGEPLVPGKFYDVTFDLEPDDQIIPAGKQIAVMLMSSDREFTLWPAPGTQLTVDLAKSTFTLPIVGGTAALANARALAR